MRRLRRAAPKSRSKSPKGSKSPKYGPVRRDPLVVLAPEGLRAAQRVAHLLAEQPREEQGEELVREEVQEAHRPALHRVDEARAVHHLALAARERAHELRHVGGGDAQVRVEDEEHVALRLREAEPHGVALSLAGLPEEAQGLLRAARRSPARSRPRCRRSSCPRRTGTPSPRAGAGRLSTSGRMWPASLRQGMTTLTVGRAGRAAADRAGAGRAMIPNTSESSSRSGSRPT